MQQDDFQNLHADPPGLEVDSGDPASIDIDTDTDHRRADADTDADTDEGKFQYGTPVVDEAVAAETAHARYDTDAGAWTCKHCGRAHPAWTVNSVNGHLSNCPNYSPRSKSSGPNPTASLPIRICRAMKDGDLSQLGTPFSPDTDAVRATTDWIGRKFDDREERLLFIAGFVAATEAWPGLDAASPVLWALFTAIALILITAIASDSAWFSLGPAVDRIADSKRAETTSRFNLAQKTVQGGFGLGVGLFVSVVNEVFALGLVDGGALDQLVQAARLLVGV